MFFNKNYLMVTNFFYLYDRVFESYRNFTTEHVKSVKIQGFSSLFSKFPKFQVFKGFFCLNCRIPGFSRIPGKVATLSVRSNNSKKS